MRASLHSAAPLALLGLPGVLAAGFYALRLIDHPVVFLQPAVLLLVSSLLRSSVPGSPTAA